MGRAVCYVIGTERLTEPPCARQGVPHGQTESGGIVLAVTCWSPCTQKRCCPTGGCANRPSVTSRLSIKLLSLTA
jgi:hypothetical protein